MSSPNPSHYDGSSTPRTKSDENENTTPETVSIDDLIPMTADQDQFEIVTEVKPEITTTIVIPKTAGTNLTEAVTAHFHSIEWVRYVEVNGELDITPTDNELHVTGTYFLTAHFNPENVTPEKSAAVTAVEDSLSEAQFIETIEEVSLRMPPYEIQEY